MAPAGGRRNLRRIVALLVVAAAALPMTFAPARVALAVDGDLETVSAYAETVGELLTARRIELAPQDRVLPGEDMPVVDGMTVEVLRAEPVLLYVQGRPQTIEVAPLRVRDVLIAAGLAHIEARYVSPPPATPWVSGTTVRVMVPLRVTVEADGVTRDVEVPPGIVADALAAAGVTLGASDRVTPERGARLGNGLVVRVTRVATDEVVEEVRLPHGEQRRETSALYQGDTRVAVEGREGVRLDIYRVLLEDGVEISRELLRSEIAREPVDRIIEVGTKPRPVAPAVPAGSVWDALAQCESGGRWDYDGRYDGGLQFHPDTWRRWRLAGYPDYAWQATREQQIEVGKRLQAAQGWWPWSGCARQLGLL